MTADLHYILVYLVSNFFTMFIIQRFYSIFFKPPSKKLWIVAGVYLLYPILTSVEHLTFNIPGLTLLLNLLCLFLITLLYDAPMVFTYVFMFLAEMLVLVASGVFHFDITDKAGYVSIASQVILKLFMFMLAIIAGNFKSIREQKFPAVLQFVSAVIITIISIYLVIVIHTAEGISRIMAFLAITSIFAINIFLFLLYDILAGVYLRNLKSEFYEKEKMYYQHECEIMKVTQEEMMAFQHDIQNHLIALEQMIQQKDEYADVKSYLSILKERTKIAEVYSDSGNLPIDSIINYKLRNAADLKISLNINIAVPQNLNIEIIDIITILGNLLDNALEALQQSQNERSLFLKILYTKGRLLIIIKNSYNGKINYKNNEIVSKKKAKNHGYGLKNVQETLKKYDGLISIDHNKTIFSVRAMIYVP